MLAPELPSVAPFLGAGVVIAALAIIVLRSFRWSLVAAYCSAAFAIVAPAAAFLLEYYDWAALFLSVGGLLGVACVLLLIAGFLQFGARALWLVIPLIIAFAPDMSSFVLVYEACEKQPNHPVCLP